MKPQSKSRKSRKKISIRMGWKDIIIYGILFIFLVFITLGFSGISGKGEEKSIPLSQVISDVDSDTVEEIIVSENNLKIKYKDGKEATSNKEPGSSFYEVLQNSEVSVSKTKITIKDNSGFNTVVGILATILPILIIVGFFYFVFRQAKGAQENIFSFGSNKAKAFNKIFPKVTFDDVAGADEAKEEMEEIVDFLKHPQKYEKFGARTPKGVLLVGPAGTGKTLLARAVAGEARVAFFSIAGSEFMEMLVGVGAARVRDLFKVARKSQPAIIFIDEIDAIGRTRGGNLMGGHDEREQTLNQILVEMDGFTPREQIIIIAATNRPDVLDSALVRPGRFDRRVVIGYPDIEGRREIVKIHSKGKPFKKSVDWEAVARRTVGFTGADLENMLNEAAILAARHSKANDISEIDIEEAATKVKLGPQKKRIQSDKDKKITAFHESGHAIVSYSMPNADPVHRISIVGRGMSLGHTLIPPSHDRVHETKIRLLEQIATMLGGRAAEEMVFSKNDTTTGAADDIEKATHIARAMVVEFGMSNLGAINLDDEPSPGMHGGTSEISESMHGKIDNEVMRILDEGMKRAVSALTKNRKNLDSVASALLEKETLDSDEFLKIMKSKTKKNAPKKISSPKK